MTSAVARRIRIVTDAALIIPCPVCDAPVDEVCRAHPMHIGYLLPHTERLELARLDQEPTHAA